MKTIEMTTHQLAQLGLPRDTISVRVHRDGEVHYNTTNRSHDLRATKPWGFSLHDSEHRIAVMERFPLGESLIKWRYAP